MNATPQIRAAHVRLSRALADLETAYLESHPTSTSCDAIARGLEYTARKYRECAEENRHTEHDEVAQLTRWLERSAEPIEVRR